MRLFMPLYADQRSLNLLAQSHATVFLIGGYDGNPNFGDILQLIGVLRILSPYSPPCLTVAVIVELGRFESHQKIASVWEEQLKHVAVLFFADPPSDIPEGLILAPTLSQSFTHILYLYGGGYVNQWWGPRKGAMVSAVATWIEDSRRETSNFRVLVTGIQASEWIVTESNHLTAWLGRAPLLRCRDAQSVTTLRKIVGHVEIGPDDAMGPLLTDTLEQSPLSTQGSPLRIGLHLNVAYYSASDRQDQFEFLVACFRQISASRQISIVPIVAYEGEEVRESDTFEAFVKLIHDMGIKIEAVLNLSLGTSVPVLESLDNIVCCSYHVAMASCLSGIPTGLIIRNAYYEQKLEGLQQWFDENILVPLRWVPQASSEDAIAMLHRLFSLNKKNNRMIRTTVGLQVAAHVLAVRQEVTEALLSAQGKHLVEISKAYTDAAADAARLRSLTGTFLNTAKEAAPSEQALKEQLAAIMNSQSWRFTAPCRKIGFMLKRFFRSNSIRD